MAMARACSEVLLFDSHCHLQDPRILSTSLPLILRSTSEAGVKWLSVNGTSEEDWDKVKKLGLEYKEIIPCFGLHPWYVETRSKNWFGRLRSMFDVVPGAAIGEAGLDKGSRGRQIDMEVQIDVLKQQLLLAKELERPIALHCVRAFGELLEVLKEMGPFPAGVILHSYLGSAEMVQPFAKCGAFFSFSGFITSLSKKKASKMLREIPFDRILLETDAPDALPKVEEPSSLLWVPGDPEAPQNSDDSVKENFPTQALNHPANIKCVLNYISSMLGLAEKDVASAAYQNSLRLFSYNGSKVLS